MAILLLTDNSNDRQVEIVNKLNTQFNDFLKELKREREAYFKMVDMNPYRVLPFNSYDWNEEPLLLGEKSVCIT